MTRLPLLRRIGLAARKALQIIFGQPSLWGRQQPGSRYDYELKVGDGLGSAVIMAPVNWISRRMSESPILIAKGKDPPDADHDLVRLLRKPNPFYSGRTMRWALGVSLNLDGNGYLVKVRNRQLKPVQLWYIPHFLMEPHWPYQGDVYIDYYRYRPGGRDIHLLPEDVVHIRLGLDPRNVRKGYGPLTALLREIFTDDEAANYTASVLRNAGVPGAIIGPESAEEEISEEDAKILKEEWGQKVSGDSRGAPLVIKQGHIKVTPFGFSPKDLDISALRDVPEERVTAMLGIPASVVGFGTGLQQTKVGATMLEQRRMAYEDCIIPLQDLVAEELEAQLLPDFEERPEDYRLLHDLSAVRVLQEDEGAKVDRAVRAFQGGLILRSEGRRRIGEEFGPEDEVYAQSMGTILVPKGQVFDPGSMTLAARLPGLKGLKAASREQRFHAQLQRAWLVLSEVQASALRRLFEAAGEEAAAAWRAVAGDRGIETLGLRAALKDIDELEIYAGLVAERVTLARKIDYGRHFLMVARRTLNDINLIFGLGLELSAPAEARIVASGGIRKGLVDFDRQTHDAVFSALRQAREAGEGAYEAARRIRELVPAGPWSSSEVRSVVIGRTETKYAQNRSSLEAYAESEDITGILVIDAQLGPTDEECEQLNGQVVSIEEARRLAESEHPNGTRSFAPVIGDKAAGGNGHRLPTTARR